MKTIYDIESVIFLYPGGNWRLLALGSSESLQTNEDFKDKLNGFSSLPIKATIGNTTFETSMFYAKNYQTFVIPIKTKVRDAEDIDAGDVVKAHIEIIV